MAKKPYPTDTLDQAKSVLNAWGQIDEQMAFGTVNIGLLRMSVQRSSGIDETLTDLENKLTDLRNQRDTSNQALWDLVKRARAGFKASYGDDSSQYEMVGGTRRSERKTPARRTPA